jgi:NAD(P)-dependent dehydrogenase (short-subunit alcohol dehydrogenase family)
MSRQATIAQDGVATLRVLVVGIDEHYRERANAVIGGLGGVTFADMRPTEPEAVGALAQHEHAGVVVLDATGCEAAVARVVAALAEAAPRLGVVVVCEHLTDAARELGALPKWGWRRDLRVAVLRAQIDGSPLAQRPADRLLVGRRDLRGVAPGSTARR